MRPRETGLVAARELREAVRNRWFLLSAASFLVLSLALAMLGLSGSLRSGVAGYDRTTASVLSLALLFVPLLTLTLGGIGIAGELEDGSLGMLLSLPVTRLEVYAGKFMGLLGAVWASILAGFGITGVVVGVASGGGNATAFVSLVALMMLLAAVTLAVGTLLSVTLRSRPRVVGAAFAVWLALVYLSDLGTIGLAIARRLSPNEVFVLALANPVEQARVLGTLSLSRRLDVLGPVGIYGLDTFGQQGLVTVLVSSLAMTALTVVSAGYLWFRRMVIP